MRSGRRVLPRVRTDHTPTQFHERTLIVSSERWGGLELRPTRLFVWISAREAGHEWLLPLGSEPRLLRRPRRRRHLTLARRVELSYLGNPVLTLTQFSYLVARRVLATRREGRAVEKRGSVSRGDA